MKIENPSKKNLNNLWSDLKRVTSDALFTFRNSIIIKQTKSEKCSTETITAHEHDTRIDSGSQMNLVSTIYRSETNHAQLI